MTQFIHTVAVASFLRRDPGADHNGPRQRVGVVVHGKRRHGGTGGGRTRGRTRGGEEEEGGGSKDSATSINVLVDGTMEYDGYINVGITLTLPSTANATSVALSNCSLEAVLPQVRGGGERDEWI